MAFTSRALFAEEAFQYSFVNEVFEDPADLDLKLESVAEQIASYSPGFVVYQKSLIKRKQKQVSDGLDRAAIWNAGMVSRQDVFSNLNCKIFILNLFKIQLNFRYRIVSVVLSHQLSKLNKVCLGNSYIHKEFPLFCYFRSYYFYCSKLKFSYYRFYILCTRILNNTRCNCLVESCTKYTTALSLIGYYQL